MVEERDYLGIDVTPSQLRMIWVDTSNSEVNYPFSVPYAAVGGAWGCLTGPDNGYSKTSYMDQLAGTFRGEQPI